MNRLYALVARYGLATLAFIFVAACVIVLWRAL